MKHVIAKRQYKSFLEEEQRVEREVIVKTMGSVKGEYILFDRIKDISFIKIVIRIIQNMFNNLPVEKRLKAEPSEITNSLPCVYQEIILSVSKVAR